jgi:hypothetical protein
VAEVVVLATQSTAVMAVSVAVVVVPSAQLLAVLV